MNIESMVNAIQKTLRTFTKDYQPQYVKNSHWVKINKDRFNEFLDKYDRSGLARREIMEHYLERTFKAMPTKQNLKEKKDLFINNFNKAAEQMGIDFRVNNRNYQKVQEFIEKYQERLDDYKYLDSAQMMAAYDEYIKPTNKYKEMTVFFKESEIFK